MVTSITAAQRSILSELERQYFSAADRSLASLRKIRKAINRRLRDVNGKTVIQIAEVLIEKRRMAQWFIFEVIHHHHDAMSKLNAANLKRLGQHLSGWGEVDPFACYLCGPAWREHQISDKQVLQWVNSKNIWWRRTALVSTVALNNKARGGKGDWQRTILICEKLKADREDMVVKALSWALRELVKHYPKQLLTYLTDNKDVLPTRVFREVNNKLETGLKNPRNKANCK